MRNFKKILVVIEPKQMRQVALERAMALARAATKGSHHIIAVLPITGEVRRRAVYTTSSAVIFFPSDVDLIIKAHEVHGMFDSVLFTPLDWQLLRHAPVPVLIAKDHIWHPTGTIAMALDLSDPEDTELRMLNVRLLREAQELCRIMHCQLHILNAIPPLLPPATIDLPGFTPDLLGDAALKEGCKAVLSFAARHRIPADFCHIREGQPDEVIPTLCAELNPTALFIGTSARKGLAVALVGNICERVVDDLDCDVAVITPKAVIERVPMAAESVTGLH